MNDFNYNECYHDLSYNANMQQVLYRSSCGMVRWIKRAFVYARTRPDGPNLGLKRFPVDIWWQGYGGLRLKNLQRQLQTLVKVNGIHPKYIIIHCGGNDIGFTKVHKIREYVVDAFKFVNEHISGAKIIWSQILPRSVWRYSTNNKACT